MDLKGVKRSVAKGEAEPISACVLPYSHFESDLVDDSFLDREKTEETNWNELIYKPLEKVGIVSNGVEDLAGKLAEQKHTIFSIGPLTNIAKLLDKFPKEAKNIERLIIMGCEISEGRLEHNIRYDSGAAQSVLDSDIPITVVPGDLCQKYCADPLELEKQLAKSSMGKYVRRMLMAFVGSQLAGKFRNEQINGTALKDLLERVVVPSYEAIKKIGSTVVFRMDSFKRRCLGNLDELTAYYETEEFWRDYRTLIFQLGNPEFGYKFGGMMAKCLESLIPKQISVADVYVPFCFVSPEKLKTERKTLSCDADGRTIILPGDKHEIVIDLDFDAFKEFIKTFIK